jgi:HAMP domain-containing protein
MPAGAGVLVATVLLVCLLVAARRITEAARPRRPAARRYDAVYERSLRRPGRW